MKKTKSICPLPWFHTYLTPQGDIYPCCSWDPNIIFGNIKEKPIEIIFNNEKYKQLRRDMMEGKEIAGCERCNKVRKLGGSVQQNAAEADLKGHIEDYDYTDTVEDIDFKFVDFRFSNKCNLRRVICGEYSSSAWGVERNVKQPLIKIMKENPGLDLKRDFLSLVKTPVLLYFAGGEPLMMEEHYEMLQHFIDLGISKNINLNYNTNLSILTWQHKDILNDYWAHYKDVHLGISLDHYDKKLEYLRFPLRSKTIIKNLQILDDYIIATGKLHIGISLTLNIFNVYDLIEIKEYYKNYEFNFNLLINPEYFAINTLPIEYKQMLIEKFKFIPEFKVVVNELLVPVNFSKDKINYLKNERRKTLLSINSKRNLNFYEYFPEEHFKWILE